MTPTELAKELYDTYKEASGGVSVISGAKLPEFEDCPEEVQRCWREVALQVLYMSRRGRFSFTMIEPEDL